MMNGRRLVTGIFGHLPGPIQTVPRAELAAVVFALQSLVVPATIYTDHYNLITDISKGKPVTCSAKHPNADLWERFWQLIFGHGGLGDLLNIKWVKAHSNNDTNEVCGNTWADRLAKMGASVHETPKADVRMVKYMRRRYRQLIRWFGKSAGYLHSNGWSDRQHRSDLPDRTQKERADLEKLRSGLEPHSRDPPSAEMVTPVTQHTQLRNMRV